MPRPKGFHHSEETKRKIGEAHKGKIQKSPSEETRKKLSEAGKGRVSAMKGKHHSEETKKRMSEKAKGRKNALGYVHPLEFRIKQSCIKRGIPIEEFDKFSSYRDYCDKFDFHFRERVRTFFNRTCVNCGKSEEDNGKRLHVHHVNFDKNTCCNASERLFVCLCNSCHSKTNHNHEYWKEYYINIINDKYNGKCYYTKEEYGRFKRSIITTPENGFS